MAVHQQQEGAIALAMTRTPEREMSQGKGKEFAPTIDLQRGAETQPGR